MSFIYWLRYILFRFVLYLTRESRKFRFKGLYDYSSVDPVKYGGYPPDKEVEEEWPKKNIRDENDSIQVFCESDSGQILLAGIERRPDGYSSVHIYLKTKDKSYNLQRQQHVDLSSEDTFSAGGLRLESVIPMRKWRISFNGLLRCNETNTDDHVKFVFTAHFITSLSDFTAFHSEQLLAHQLATKASWELLFSPNDIAKHLQEIQQIVQSYTFVGKVATGEALDQHEEFYSFGFKRRFQEKLSSSFKCLGTVMAFTKNGIALFVEEARIEKYMDSFTYSCVTLPSLQHDKVDSISPLPVLKDGQIVPFEFKVGTLPNLPVTSGSELNRTSITQYHNNEACIRDVRVLKISIDGNEAHAVHIGALRRDSTPVELPSLPLCHYPNGVQVPQTTAHNVLMFTNEECMNSNVTGGKASSLAVLSKIAKESQKFSVAPGAAVTTKAYEKFISHAKAKEAIKILEGVLADEKLNQDLEIVKAKCGEAQKIIEEVPLPADVAEDIKSVLNKMFADLSNHKFAVRSSACGEDSEDMSAAGQMETLLGVKGIDNIIQSVAKCWASQFSFVAVQYRRRYGQVLNCPMAVCIQEMVSSEVSGVMFTIDPATSNPKYISITANYGLGESVVSAAADPDTFKLEKIGSRNVKVVEKNVGAKKLRTVMKEDGGTEDIIEKANVSELCLNDQQLQLLGETAVLLETKYASARDTEWAFNKGTLYMLQSRPVTNVHSLDVDFEYRHEHDGGVVSNLDCLSKANVGEVFGGSVSILSQDTAFRSFIRLFKELFGKQLGIPTDDIAHARELFLFTQNGQSFFGTMGPMGDNSDDSLFAKGFAIAMSGRIVDDDIATVSRLNKRKYTLIKKVPRPQLAKLCYELWTAEKVLDESEKQVMKTKMRDIRSTTSAGIFAEIMSNPLLMEKALKGHGAMITYGSLCNVMALALLAHTEGDWNHRVFSDFAKMVSSCNDLVSADIPVSLQKLAHQVVKDFGEGVKDKPAEEVLELLKKPGTESYELFQYFLKTHGHRCLHEFDLVTRVWEMNPIPVIKNMQSMIGNTQLEEKKDITISELVDSLDIKTNFLKKLFLHFIVKRVRRGVTNRERGKNILIYATHQYRKRFRVLAAQMVKEGRLPEEDLLFYLIPYEIKQLLETRSPKLINRAMMRMRNARTASKDIYAELNAGLPFVPINHSEEVIAVGDRSMKGTPVSQGKVVAPCRVILSLDQAHEIQKGDILITYATDIGWSPYFPLLSGIVTELGGLISHGAVVAREYGLPCIVGAHGATRMFKSGEMVVLDGSRGVLQTVAQ